MARLMSIKLPLAPESINVASVCGPSERRILVWNRGLLLWEASSVLLTSTLLVTAEPGPFSGQLATTCRRVGNWWL